MIRCIGWLLEMIAILLCIHELYGKKFYINVKNIIVIAMDIILLQSIVKGYLSNEMSILIYPIVFFYCIVEFGVNKRELVVNNILYIVILGILQMGAWMVLDVFHIIPPINSGRGIINLMVNTIVFLIVCIVIPHIGLHKVSVFMQQKVVLLRILLIIASLFLTYLLIIMKVTNYLAPEQYIIIIISLCLLAGVTYMWQKNQYKVKEQQIELQMYNMYEESFQNLVSDIRSRQHDFDNHINAVYSQHYTSTTLEELVEKQRKYCEVLREDNKYNKLLSAGNSIITGFLYGKFLQAEGKGITVKYKVKLGELESPFPTYKLVEIIGNFFDNAMEALEQNGCEKVIFLDLVENREELNFTIRNENPYISQEDLLKLFEKGKSSKGNQRGIGLFNVKKICEEYHCELLAANKREEGKTYIEFGIHWRKDYRKEYIDTIRRSRD